MENVNTATKSILGKFLSEIELLIKEKSSQYADIAGQTPHESVWSFGERYGIGTHTQYYTFILAAQIEISSDQEKIKQIIDALIEDPDFQKGAFYWGDIQCHMGYRYPKIIDEKADELLPVIKQSLQLRNTFSKNWGCRLELTCLGLLKVQELIIPCLYKAGGNLGHKYWSYWPNSAYFQIYLPCIKKHVQVLTEVMYEEVDTQEEYFKWGTKAVLGEIKKYVELIYEPLLK